MSLQLHERHLDPINDILRRIEIRLRAHPGLASQSSPILGGKSIESEIRGIRESVGQTRTNIQDLSGAGVGFTNRFYQAFEGFYGDTRPTYGEAKQRLVTGVHRVYRLMLTKLANIERAGGPALQGVMPSPDPNFCTHTMLQNAYQSNVRDHFYPGSISTASQLTTPTACPLALPGVCDPASGWAVDHFVPVVYHWNHGAPGLGGTHVRPGRDTDASARASFYTDIDNLWYICGSCNSSKGGKPIEVNGSVQNLPLPRPANLQAALGGPPALGAEENYDIVVGPGFRGI